MEWYLKVIKNYAGFSGRARRKEYWMFVLFNLVIAIVLAVVEGLLGGPGILGLIYALAVLLPSIAVAIRRLHDTGRSGWWLLVVFVPFIGGLILLYFLVLDSQPGSNEHGPNPKGL